MSEQNVIEPSSYNAAEDYDSADFGNRSDDSDFGNSDGDSGDDGGQSAPGTGQSKSSRRRRRKRKNKVAGEGGPSAAAEGDSSAAVPFVMEGESIAAAAPQQQPQPRKRSGGGSQGGGAHSNAGHSNGSQNGSQGGSSPNGQQNAQGAGGKRWKKKFRDRDRRSGGGGRSENPGNDFRADSGSNGGSNGGSFSNGYRQNGVPDNFGNLAGGFKRKNKGGGGGKERGFVGPMDHSYRGLDGETGGPPSTINLHANGRGGHRGGHRHHGDSQPIDHSMPRPVPIPEGAQTHIYFFIEELFFQAKIQETAKKLGVKVAFIKNEKEVLASLTDGEENKPALIVFDLNNANAKPLTLIPKLKTKLKRSASIVGFLSHLQGDLKAKAVEAGCDVVMPRAAFSQNLPNLLRRYGVEEEEEVNFNR
jgi:hypothetical protein